MDHKIEIKEEPVWLGGPAVSSLENFEFVSEMISLKQETNSELAEPGPAKENTFRETFEPLSEMILLKQETTSELTEPVPAQENAFEPATDIEDKIMVPDFKEENKKILNLYRK
ncbi:uncharacterized protein [Anabrus simplex]|uniref:uncharacterized protein n=1 Tax=Anabrus simplex TaxID=316456 RepID=UPI0034DD40F3